VPYHTDEDSAEEAEEGDGSRAWLPCFDHLAFGWLLAGVRWESTAKWGLAEEVVDGYVCTGGHVGSGETYMQRRLPLANMHRAWSGRAR
jgi:hypothetical protein